MARKKVTVAIPTELFESADARADADKISRSQLFTDAIRLYLEGVTLTRYDRSMNEVQGQIQTLENALRESEESRHKVEEINRTLIAKVKAEGENCERALAEQEHRHKDVLDEGERRHKDITNALRHEHELTQSELKATQRERQTEREHNRELRDDKEQLQKQLELVTLRLPAPKEGFWSRVFGRKKKEQETQA